MAPQSVTELLIHDDGKVYAVDLPDSLFCLTPTSLPGVELAPRGDWLYIRAENIAGGTAKYVADETDYGTWHRYAGLLSRPAPNVPGKDGSIRDDGLEQAHAAAVGTLAEYVKARDVVPVYGPLGVQNVIIRADTGYGKPILVNGPTFNGAGGADLYLNGQPYSLNIPTHVRPVWDKLVADGTIIPGFAAPAPPPKTAIPAASFKPDAWSMEVIAEYEKIQAALLERERRGVEREIRLRRAEMEQDAIAKGWPLRAPFPRADGLTDFYPSGYGVMQYETVWAQRLALRNAVADTVSAISSLLGAVRDRTPFATVHVPASTLEDLSDKLVRALAGVVVPLDTMPEREAREKLREYQERVIMEAIAAPIDLSGEAAQLTEAPTSLTEPTMRAAMQPYVDGAIEDVNEGTDAVIRRIATETVSVEPQPEWAAGQRRRESGYSLGQLTFGMGGNGPMGGE